MRKKTLKQQKEDAQKAALLQRITDVYSGAQGAEWDHDNDFATAEILGQVIPVFVTMFDHNEGLNYLFNVHSLRHFDNPKRAMEHLFSAGIRA